MGYCGLDRERRPLRGDEIRACWEAGPDTPEAPAAGIPRSAPTPATAVEDRTPVRRLEFVEVGTGARMSPAGRAAAGAITDGGAEPALATDPGPPETRWSLWGDLEG
jgi:hypothetical protein